jgi:hypothetical protein
MAYGGAGGQPLVTIKLYVEGGGDDNDALRTACREGFRKLLGKAGLGGRMPRVVACGSRAEAFKKFCIAVRGAGPGEFMCLLVDSEDRVEDDSSPWAFLRTRQADQWAQPVRTSDENAHLMVQCMEAWFLADPEAVECFFRLDPNALPRRTQPERIPKRDVFTALKNATRNCTNGPYRKGEQSFRLLATLDPDKLAASSPYAARLFDTLRRKAQGTEA